jgi:hypothetical protein
MRPEEIRKLIGGYATGTLTEAEREALFAAALDDQELFNELAGEESLRELLSDPAARAEMLAAVAPRPRVWAWWRPAVAALAVATIGTVIVLMPRKKAPAPAPPPTIVAEVKPPAPATVDRPVPPKRMRKTAPPPAPAAEAVPVPELPKAGVAGGTPGGVLGGIMSAPRAAAPAAPLPPPTFSNSFAPSTLGRLQVTFGAPPTARAFFFQQLRLGIRYSIVRDEDAGTVALKITANANGFVSVAGGDPVALTAMQPYTTGPLEGSEVRVVFARTPEKALTGTVAVLTETSIGELFVVASAPGPELGFTVPLSQQ